MQDVECDSTMPVRMMKRCGTQSVQGKYVYVYIYIYIYIYSYIYSYSYIYIYLKV